MNKFNNIILIAFFHYLFPLFCYASSNSVDLRHPDSPSELSKGQGYLLINLDVSGVAPSFDFVKLNAKKQSDLRTNKKITKNGRSYRIDLKEKINGFYVASLPKGYYQITKISAPYFNLPYWLDTDHNRSWRFHIAEGKLNYVGKLFINKERSTNSVDIKLFNRIATEKLVIEKDLAHILNTTPLALGTGVRDDFYRHLTGRQQE